LTAEKEPGQSEVLPIGWESDINTPAHPNRELTAFKASMLKDVASGFNVEYSNFANDWTGVSFSSVRVGTISERDMYITDQNDYIAQNKKPCFSCMVALVPGLFCERRTSIIEIRQVFRSMNIAAGAGCGLIR